jgi:hypothetical protein
MKLNTMKKSNLLIGALGGVAVVTGFFLNSTINNADESKYYQDKGSLEAAPSASHYQQWLNSKMIDTETGELITEEKLASIMANHALKPKTTTVEWMEHGPDNIGGRTRAVHVDYKNINNVWSGGVTGGLYVSRNRGNTWSRVLNFPGNQFISSIAQDKDGNLYVATGSLQEGSAWQGNGLYVTPDDGETWELVPGTGNITRINRLVSSRTNAEVFFTANSGAPLRKYVYGGTVEAVSGYTGTGANVVELSDDGNIMVVANNVNRTFVSTDGGQTFVDRSGNQTGQISPGGVARIEYGISKKKSDGTYSIYASTVNGGQSNNQGQWISLNSGETWHRHTPATGANVGNGVIDFRNQGTWNNIVSFDPSNTNRAIVGGIDLHEWVQVIDNPPTGGWNQISLWFVSPTSPVYVHADQHDIHWDETDRMYVGNDGGIQISEDYGNTYFEANRGYNITQFFRIAYDRHGSVIGGTQDNGSLYNNHKNTTWQEFRRMTGGDGFSAEIGFYNPNFMITSSQFNTLHRSTDGGVTFNPFVPQFPAQQGIDPTGGDGGGHHPFHTTFVLAEYFDPNSEDSLTFIPQQSYNVGDTVLIPSMAVGHTIQYETPHPIFFTDTLLFFPDSTRTEYLVVGANTGLTYDLGTMPFSFFGNATQVIPPLIGDTLLIEGVLGLDTVVVGSVTPYDFHVGVNPNNPSQSIDMGMDTVLFAIPWDTLRVADPFQSWFVLALNRNGGELWGTRDALRLSNPNPRWVRIADNLGGAAMDIEFSEDLQYMFVSGGPFIGSTSINNAGPIHRIDGLGSVYTSDPGFLSKVSIDHGATATSKTQIGTIANCTGIGIDPRNPDILVATQGFNGSVFRSSNATSMSPTLTQVGSQGGLAFYDVIIDRDDSDILFAATNMGVSMSENGGATWTDVTHPTFVGVPCYHIKQSWRTWEEGNRRPGEIFVGTHGRGIWSTDAVLSTVENDKIVSNTAKKKKEMLLIYPNPAVDHSTVVINMKQEGDVMIYFYDLSGNKVKTISQTNLFVGRNDITFTASDLPKGTYIIKAHSTDKVETGKFIKM